MHRKVQCGQHLNNLRHNTKHTFEFGKANTSSLLKRPMTLFSIQYTPTVTIATI